MGDIAGIRSRLPYLRDLGVDAIWITPWYPSPMADGGYDVADYRDIDPLFGTLADADALIEDAHAAGIRVIIDIVPNHTSDRHPWFLAALAAGSGSPERTRYLFRDGKGATGAIPPNDWQSGFGGPAWTRVVEADGRPGQWYLHLFAREQPDLDWSNPEVRAEFESIVRFWFDRGVDGFRIDVAMSLAKAPGLPDLGGRSVTPGDGHPYWDLDDVHEVWRSWRRIADEYPGERVFVAEAHTSSPGRRALYVRPDELHTAFNFDHLRAPWEAEALRAVIEATIASLGEVGAPPTWVLSNHDETRHVTRYGWPRTGVVDISVDGSQAADLALGTRRARAAALLMLALPGGCYVYQGEELGLWQVADIPEELLQDPIWERSGHTIRGRDGCRVPIPWSGDAPPFGFGPPGSTPWLPQPPEWRGLTAEAEAGSPRSMLGLYRAALRLRREHPGFGGESMHLLDSPRGVLLFDRAEGLRCAVNISDRPFRLPPGEVILSSVPLEDGRLPVDAAAWIGRR